MRVEEKSLFTHRRSVLTAAWLIVEPLMITAISLLH